MIIATLQEFYSFFQIGRQVAAIDYGTGKIGLALSCPAHKLSMPWQSVFVPSLPQQINRILTILAAKGPCAVVIGLPLNMDGTASSQTILVQKFATMLADKTSLPIFLQDERLTSKEAGNYLKHFGINRKKRNKIDDLTAASMILETILTRVTKLSLEVIT